MSFFSLEPIMQKRPHLAWAAVWFGVAAFCRAAWLLNPVPSERMVSASSAGFFLLLCCWCLLQHWLDKRESARRTAESTTEWARWDRRLR